MAESPEVDPVRGRLLAALEAGGVDDVLIGGAALETHRQPHRTVDVDITPSTDAGNLQRLADVLNALECRLLVDPSDPASAVPLPPGYFDPVTLGRADVWNLRTRHGDLDVCLRPAGFPQGYVELLEHAERLQAAGTQVVVSVAALHDVEHSKRTAGRIKDIDYLMLVGRLDEPDAASPPGPGGA